jgi:hypothetical protein
MLKQPVTVVGLDPSSEILDPIVLKSPLIGDLPFMVFSDDPITKMHDSLPMILPRFCVLLELYEAREFGWLAFFVPWAMMNEAMSHKQAQTVGRLGWLRGADCDLMQCALACRDSILQSGMSMFGRRDAPDDARRGLFEKNWLMHATNTLEGIIYEIQQARKPISLQRITTVPLEKVFGITRLHAHTQQTMENGIRQMEMDQAMKLVYARREVKNRRLAYGQTVQPCSGRHPFQYEPILLAEALSAVVRFPIQREFALDRSDDSVHYVDYLMSDAIQPFATIDLSAMSMERRRSLSQEFLGVGPSRRRILLTSKADTKKVIASRPSDPTARQLTELFGGKHIFSSELKLLVRQVCDEMKLEFRGSHSLERSTKSEILDWITEHWNQLSGTFRVMAINHPKQAGHETSHQ